MSNTDTTEDLAAYLQPTASVESDNPDIIAFARDRVGDESDQIEMAKKLYYAVRDEFVYDPYHITLDHDGLGATGCFKRGSGFCVAKSALLAASCRSVGIPARVGYADVRNHISSKRLDELLETDMFVYHGYAELYLEGKWVKATPVFNLSLCEKARVNPLEFDGRNNSIFHPYNADGKRHMEYVKDHGAFVDVPIERIKDAFKEYYPKYFEMKATEALDGDFEAEAEAGNVE